MQRAAARQLTGLLICPLRRHQALLLNATFLHPAAASADEILPSLHHLHLRRSLHELTITRRPIPDHLHRSLHELAIAHSPAPLTVLRNCIHLSVLVRFLSNGSPLSAVIVQNSDGLPSTQQSITDEKNARCDQNEASSPSDIVPQAITNGGVKVIDDPVLESQSSLGNDISTDSSEVCAKRSFEQKFGCLSEFPVDASSVSFILDNCGWGPHTEGILQSFIGSITPELVANVVHDQKDGKVAFHFIEWASKQNNFKYREEIFTKVVGRLGKRSEFEAMWTVLEFMKKHGLNVNYAFGVFIHRLRSANMVDAAVRAMDSMVSLDVTPTVHLYTVAFQVILNANNLKDAQRLYVKMRQVGLQPDTKLFGILISGFGKAGKVDNALFFFEEMQRSGVPPDSIIYTSLIGAFAAVGRYAEGQKFYTEMVQNNCLPSVLSRPDLECALYGVSSMEQIQRFLEGLEIRGHLISVQTYNNMLQHLLDNKMLTEAVEVFCRLLEEPQKRDGLLSPGKRAARPNAESYSLIICVLCKEGKLTEALLLFKEMLTKGFRLSSEVCNCLLHGLSSNEGFMYEAVELSSHFLKAKLSVDVKTQKAFFSTLHTGGDMSKALQIFNAMKWKGCIDPSSNFHALIDVGTKNC